jgi:hypothetical protein
MRRFKAPYITRQVAVSPICAFFDAIAAVAEVATAIGGEVAAGASAIGAGVADAAGVIGGGIADAAGAVGSGIAGAAGAIGEGVGAVADSVGSGISGIFGGGAAGAAPATEGAVGGAGNFTLGGALAPTGGTTVGGAGAGALSGASLGPGNLAAASSDVAASGGLQAADAGINNIGNIVNGTASAGSSAAPAAASSAASAATTAPSFTSQLGDALNSPFVKAAGIGISGANLLGSVIGGQQSSTALKNLENTANSQQAQGQTLQSFLQNGTLPPGVQNTINLAEKNAEATVRSRYASQGQSGSTAEAQDIANAKLEAANQGTQAAERLLQQGISESDLSGKLFNQILSQQTQQNAQVGSAISNFASALGGGPRVPNNPNNPNNQGT